MRSRSDYLQAISLLDRGHSSIDVSRRLGIPSSTVRLWRRTAPTRARQESVGAAWRPNAERTYCYVFGLYLGDGHIATPRGNPFLRIFLDAQYEGIVAEARNALEVLWPTTNVRQHSPADVRLTILQLSHADLPYAFPQHGPGKKHTRRIALEPWQAELTAQHPEALLRGLIHSDGCRTINRFKIKLPSGRVGQYEYPRAPAWHCSSGSSARRPDACLESAYACGCGGTGIRARFRSW
jgi:hypothetical protein